MLPTSESNNYQISTTAFLEESKSKRGIPNDGLPKTLIETGISTLIHLFDEIFSLLNIIDFFSRKFYIKFGALS